MCQISKLIMKRIPQFIFDQFGRDYEGSNNSRIHPTLNICRIPAALRTVSEWFFLSATRVPTSQYVASYSWNRLSLCL